MAGDRRKAAGARAVKFGAALVLAALLGGCGFFVSDYVHERWAPSAAAAPIGLGAVGRAEAAAPEGAAREMVGLAFSGGGSRAAVFAAAMLAEIDAAGLAERITHISSVSGGGFAAGYYMARRPPNCAGGDCRRGYFRDFRAAMRADLARAALGRQLRRPGRITSPTRRALSLQEALDRAYLDGATFGDLPARPVLLINAARYDDARRFVFSQAALPDAAEAEPILGRDARLRAASFSQPGCPRPAPEDLPLSLAVTASAAFPPVFGPVTFAGPADCGGAAREYWHLGDGGVVENSGVDTLDEVVLRAAASGAPLRRALILEVDAGKRHDPAAMKQEPDVRLWTSNPGIVVDVAQARGQAYRDALWQRLGREIGVPVTHLRLRYTEAGLSAWPAACAAEARRYPEPMARLREIPTGLSITDCDAELMEAAARALAPLAIAALGRDG